MKVEEGGVMGASVLMSGKYDNSDEKVKLPYWKEGDDKKKLVDEVLHDKGLRTWRKLADRNVREYSWRVGLLIKKCINKVTKLEREVIVLPKSRREVVLKLADDSSGHLISRKVISVVERCFMWP